MVRTPKGIVPRIIRINRPSGFGFRVIVASNDPDEMEKAIKYNALIANGVVLQNIIDYSTSSIYQLCALF